MIIDQRCPDVRVMRPETAIDGTGYVVSDLTFPAGSSQLEFRLHHSTPSRPLRVHRPRYHRHRATRCSNEHYCWAPYCQWM